MRNDKAIRKEQINIRVNAEERKRIAKAAKRDRRSMSNFIRVAVFERIEVMTQEQTKMMA